jgi:hypothetical protein
MWGEYLALLLAPGSKHDEQSVLVGQDALMMHLWDTSLAVARQALLWKVAEMQRDAQQQQQQRRQQRCDMQMVLCEDSWYRSCVELIVPSLLHMKAAGNFTVQQYTASAGVWFSLLAELTTRRLTYAMMTLSGELPQVPLSNCCAANRI